MDPPGGFSELSPIVSACESLRTIHPNWHVELSRRNEDGWIPGEAFTNAVVFLLIAS